MHHKQEQDPFNKYHIWASVGTSGKRGLYVSSDDDFAKFAACTFRSRIKEATQKELNTPVIRVIIQTNKSVHIPLRYIQQR